MMLVPRIYHPLHLDLHFPSRPGDRDRYHALLTLLIETTPGESDDDLRAMIDSMLANVWDPPQAGWWHEYDLGRVFEFTSRQYREVQCNAGSVAAHLISHASKTDQPRSMILIAADRNGNSVGEIIAKSQSQPMDPAHLRYVDSKTP